VSITLQIVLQSKIHVSDAGLDFTPPRLPLPRNVFLAMRVISALWAPELQFLLISETATYVLLDISARKALKFDRLSKKLLVPSVLSTTRREPRCVLTAFLVPSTRIQTSLHLRSVSRAATPPFQTTRPQLVCVKGKIASFSRQLDLAVANLDTMYTKLCRVVTRTRNRIQLLIVRL